MSEDHDMRVVCGQNEYRWIDHWAKIPATESARTGWAHHGIVTTEGGQVITFHQSERKVLVLDAVGNIVRSWQTDLAEGHGMTLVKEAGAEYLWIADNGSKRRPELNYEYSPAAATTSGQVVKMDLNGRVVMSLPNPKHQGYGGTRYAPTSVTVDEERFGGSGDVWVADGYGLSCVHRFDKEGAFISTIDGSEGSAGRFNTPHSVYIDRRRQRPEIYVADRSNKRIQVYDLQGNFKRAFGSEFLTSPSGFAVHGGFLFIAELRARLAVLDINDRLVGYIGDNEVICYDDGWPNMKDTNGKVVPTDRLRPGKFNSPHGIATDGTGTIYVAEWLIGGRIVKLLKI